MKEQGGRLCCVFEAEVAGPNPSMRVKYFKS